MDISIQAHFNPGARDTSSLQRSVPKANRCSASPTISLVVRNSLGLSTGAFRGIAVAAVLIFIISMLLLLTLFRRRIPRAREIQRYLASIDHVNHLTPPRTSTAPFSL